MERMTQGTAALTGKIAFVAGGSGGINLAVAEGFAEAGAKVAVISRSLERITTAAEMLRNKGYEAIGLAADVRDYVAIENAMVNVADTWGPIDIVLSGAAGNFVASAKDLSSNGFRTVVDIDLIGTFNVFRASWDHIRKPGASLIAITAGQAVLPTQNQIHACAAKAGVNMVTKVMAMEWGPYGVRVNGISPGPIADTEGMRRLTPTPEAEAAFKATIPLGAYGEKRDVAALAVFLCSNAARNITGAIVDCDGGATLTGGSHNSFRADAQTAGQ
jgi:NAD(P)-dependent dehydrogenase (short-subunit alcohol dehydrogenase family)